MKQKQHSAGSDLGFQWLGSFTLAFSGLFSHSVRVSLVVQTVKNPPAMQEIRVQSLGRKDPLEESVATHSNILAWRIPWTEEPGGYGPWGCKELDTTE